MKSAIGYIRVSTKHQALNGSSLEAQEEAIRTFAQQAGYELLSVECDVGTARGVSSISQRKGLQRAISQSKNAGAVIIVWDASRFSRDLKSFEELLTASMPEIVDIEGNSLSGSPGMEARIARAEIESDHLRRNTSHGIARARRNGVKFGNSVNLSEARQKGIRENIRRAEKSLNSIACTINRHRMVGILTRDGLVAALNAEGCRTPYGKEWTRENIRHTLTKLEKSGMLYPHSGAL